MSELGSAEILLKLEKLSDQMSTMQNEVTGKLATQGTEIAQLTKEKTQLFELYNDQLSPKMDDLKLQQATLIERLRSNMEKITETREEVTKGLTSIRREFEQQDEKLDRLEKSHDEAEGKRKMWVRIEAALIALAGVGATIYAAIK